MSADVPLADHGVVSTDEGEDAMSRHAKHAMPAIPAGNIRTTPISALALQMSHAIRVYFEREAMRRQLHAMSDRELADMGIARSGIDAAMDSWNGRS